MAMQTGAPRKQDAIAVDLTPMLDVVFILLIFFVVTASFLKETVLPLLGQPSMQPDKVEPSDSMLFIIDSGNRIFLNQRAVEPTALRSWIAQNRAGNEDVSVLVRPHNDSTAEALVQILNAAREAGVRDIKVLE